MRLKLPKINFILLLALMSNLQPVYAEGISKAVCDSHKQVMYIVLTEYREIGLPVNDSISMFDSEDYRELRYWLRSYVRKGYKNPARGVELLSSGFFDQNCLEIHRGY